MGLDPASQRPVGPSEPSVAFAAEPEDPAVVLAMSIAAEVFPELLPEKERVLRSRFREILPFSFDRIEWYGRSDLDRNAALLSRLSAEAQQWSSLDLARSIQALIDALKPHGLLGKLRHSTLDATETHRRLGGLSQAGEAIARRVDALASEQPAIAAALEIHLAVLTVCASMPGRFADLTQRRSTLFTQASKECQIAGTQIETLGTGVQEAILRLDEVRNVTVPGLGFT